jgi:sugar phosphate isomerase/epimerase
VLSGQRHPDVGEEEGIGRVVESIESLLPAAEAAGVVLTIENHYKDGTWEYPEFAQSRERFLRILHEIDSPWLKVQYDPSNAVVAGIDPYALLDEVLERVATMHASDRFLEGGSVGDLAKLDADPLHGYAKLLRHGVIGEGFNDFDRIFGTLAGAGFRGWVSIEDGEGATVEEGMENLRLSAEFLRGKLAAHFGEGGKLDGR